MNEITENWGIILNFMIEEFEISHLLIENYIKPMKLYSIEGNCIYFVVPDEHKEMLDFLKRKYLEPLKLAIIEITKHDYTIELLLSNEVADMNEDKKINSLDLSIINEKVEIAGLRNEYRFDTFVVGESNRLTYSTCLAAAESPGSSYCNPLFLYGGVGLGKTHLMQSIARYIIETRPEKKVIYVTSEDFTNELVQAIRTNTQPALKDKYRNVDVLLVDDIQFLEKREGTQEEFFHTFNVLYNAGKQIVISADKPPQELQNIEKRLVSRFASGVSTDLTNPDYETRMAILQKKINMEHYNFKNEVLEYIASNFTSNIREMEGAIKKLIAYNNLVKKEITLEIAQRELRDLISPNNSSEVTMDTIINIVTSHYNVSEDDIISRKRSANIVLPRFIIMYFCRNLTDSTLADIGKRIGGRDYTTVINALDNINKKYNEDINLKNTIDMLRKKIVPY